MSWTTINEIIGLATVDPYFCEELLLHPLFAVQEQGFELTPLEQNIFELIQAQDLSEFSQIVLDQLTSKHE